MRAMKMRLSHLVFAFLLSTVCMVDAAWADDVDEDVHRVEVFLTGDVSYRVLKITRVDFDGDDSVTPKLIPSTSHAVAPGGALGIKLWFLSLALRGDVGFFDSSRGDAFDGQFRM